MIQRRDVRRVHLSGRSGHEQKGSRLAIVVQTDDLPLSTVVVIPMSTRARPTSFRPAIRVGRETAYVLAEQITTVDTQRIGERVGRVTVDDMGDIEQAVRDVLGFL